VLGFFCSSPQRPESFWGPPSLLSNDLMGTGALSQGIKRPGRETDHSPPSIKVNVKLKLPLCFFQLSTVPLGRIGEWIYSPTHSLIAELDGGEWSRPGRSTPRKRAPGTQWIGGTSIYCSRG